MIKKYIHKYPKWYIKHIEIIKLYFFITVIFIEQLTLKHEKYKQYFIIHIFKNIYISILLYLHLVIMTYYNIIP